ncbi:hypothetical protein MYX75_08930 [Acidobacteria bacterium AH-259-A15]|nr:hypothetical protein [Acidobacteria bacterium AH-259-A15]
MVPQEKGHYAVSIGAVKMTTADQTGSDQYCELGTGIEVAEDYYLKLFPASFIRKVDEAGKEHFNLRIDAYSKKDDMLKNGWKHFETLEEMNEAADIENQPAGVRELLIREVYTIWRIIAEETIQSELKPTVDGTRGDLEKRKRDQ